LALPDAGRSTFLSESVLRESAVVPAEALSKYLPFFAQMGGILGGLLC
jgi:hypothetical protein